ncbi:hypothetical protein AUR04nite_05650 [Glutamicibacter uratoxydans]|uniref:Metallothionein n=1 Tax=Glutamicibacter uratoxydans TaxID=43667 RepID=A0A4Y4DKC6_GLUUR|nr:hypothetical protein [Glutamicibacter uratoxydans]GED05033.1 hypothetical protein AUR04nite_05650 [Glutamicibacter uratoxydans]
MATCSTCGNETERPLELAYDGRAGKYDSFECAIHDLAERCAHCDCTIIGHPVYAGGAAYCCEHCSGIS